MGALESCLRPSQSHVESSENASSTSVRRTRRFSVGLEFTTIREERRQPLMDLEDRSSSRRRTPRKDGRASGGRRRRRSTINSGAPSVPEASRLRAPSSGEVTAHIAPTLSHAALGTSHWQSVSCQESIEDVSSVAESEGKMSASSYCESGILHVREALRPGCILCEKYRIIVGSVPGKLRIRYGMRICDEREVFVLKFYPENNGDFERATRMHRKLCISDLVATLFEPLQARDVPPCLVLEKGNYTIEEWCKMRSRSVPDKKSCLHQVLTAVAELHELGVVHRNLMPSNVVFFVDGGVWKLIALDRAQEKGEEPETGCPIQYSPPEVIQSSQKGQPIPLVHPSIDAWGLGILIFEVITEKEFYVQDISLESVADFLASEQFELRLDLIGDPHCQMIARNFLKWNASERWSVKEALETTL